jgi:hypothetical protein
MRTLVPLAAVAMLSAPAAADETIVIHDPIAQPAEPVHPQPPLLRYSDEAVLSNHWGRAWLLLDIDSTGFVTRLKFLNRPGRDLDPIAIETAFATRFTPALDYTGHPVHSRLVWSLEWPSWWWSHEHAGTGVPPCRGSGPLNLGGITANPVYRDCSKPDLGRIPTEPWIYSNVR